MRQRRLRIGTGHLLGTVGLFLLLLLGKLVPLAAESPRTARQRAQSLLARRAIDAIAMIGWLADRLPQERSAHQRVSTPISRAERLSV